jgi:trigger factor
MPKITKSDLGENHIKLEVLFEEQEVHDELKKGLKKEQKNANLKGFRKGKAPITTLKRLYGERILAQTVYDQLNRSLSEYIEENQINYIGEPLALNQPEDNPVGLKTIQDYKFDFELALAPDIELKGLSEDTEYKMFDVVYSDEEVNEQLNKWQKQTGGNESIEGPAEENDIIQLELLELNTEGQIKDGGLEVETKILVKDIDSDELKKELLGKKVGDELELNVLDLAPGQDEEHLRKYILNIDSEKEFNHIFKAGIDDILRLSEAELDQGFFDRVFGPDKVTNLDEAKLETKKFLKQGSEMRAKELLFKDVREKLQELNTVEIPNSFLEKWTSQNKELKVNGEEELKQFKQDLSWSLIRSALSKKLGVEVEQQELMETAYREVYQYGIQDRDMADKMVKQLMSNKEYVQKMANNIETGKLIEAVAETAKIKKEEISVEKFEQYFNEVAKKVQEEQNAIAES